MGKCIVCTVPFVQIFNLTIISNDSINAVNERITDDRTNIEIEIQPKRIDWTISEKFNSQIKPQPPYERYNSTSPIYCRKQRCP